MAGASILHKTNAMCFGADVLIRTNAGDLPAGELKGGDMVATRDGGFQPVRRTASWQLSIPDLRENPQLLPILIRKNTLGMGLPMRDLLVSPGQRLLVRSQIALSMFGVFEVLTAARHLCDVPGVEVAEHCQAIEYVQIMLDACHVIFANGIDAELMARDTLMRQQPRLTDEPRVMVSDLSRAVAWPDTARRMAATRPASKRALRHRRVKSG